MTTNRVAIMVMDDLREVVESTGVVEVAVGRNDDNLFPNKFCVSQVAKKAEEELGKFWKQILVLK